MHDSRHDTIKHIKRVRQILEDVARKIKIRGFGHDSSKLSEPEKSTFDEYDLKLREVEYGSKEYKESLMGMGKGLKHHYENNRHHPEHFSEGIQGMNLIDLVEMMADWKASTERVKNGNLSESIEKNQERFGYGEEIKRIMINTAKECFEEEG